MFPSDRFAAFLAHSLNAPDEQITLVQPGHLFVLALDALTTRYRDTLLFNGSYAARMSADEAAERYFDATLGRRLWLSNRADVSVSHRLLLALCQRGIGVIWRDAVLVRGQARSAQQEGAAALVAPGAIEALAERLARLSTGITTGNPAATIHERKGPLVLIVGPRSFAVAEEISLWDAVKVSPARLRHLAPGEAFNRFCGILIDALRTANRPFQEVLGLGRGLCPFDWLDALSINQIRGLRRFVEKLDDAGDAATLQNWSTAWNAVQVPGFGNVRELWNSDIGRALRQPAMTMSSIPIESLADEPADQPEVLDRAEFVRRLAELRKMGAIDDAERLVLERLYEGDSLSELAAEPAINAAVAERRVNFRRFIADLHRRIEALAD